MFVHSHHRAYRNKRGEIKWRVVHRKIERKKSLWVGYVRKSFLGIKFWWTVNEFISKRKALRWLHQM